MKLPGPLQQTDRTFVLWRGQKLSYFAGCDYYRLASHPEVLRAAETALRKYGLNVAASRSTTGNHLLHEKLEAVLANFFDAESATLASNGYLPNLLVAQALKGGFSHVLIDEHAHASLVDAAQLFDCPVLAFRHRDAGHLAEILSRLGRVSPVLLTDGMFSHDGSIAPLKDYLAALTRNAVILLDDAHGAGVLGAEGRGAIEQCGVSRRQIIQTITLSKAFGVYGGAVIAPKKLRGQILEKSRIFTGNTPLPLPLASAAITSVSILRSKPALRIRLRRNVAFVKEALADCGIKSGLAESPIFAIEPRNTVYAKKLCDRLLKSGIHPPFIKYPGGPKNGFFRFAISSEHTAQQLEKLVAAIRSDRRD
jgi:glycine C-acetyltransferase/8-amino-7-oxononanoate synthase